MLWRVEGAAEDFGTHDCVEEFTLAQLQLCQYEPRLEEEGGPDVSATAAVRFLAVSLTVLTRQRST